MSLALFQNDSHETGSEGRACARRPSGFTSRGFTLRLLSSEGRPSRKSVYFARVRSTGRSSRGPTLVRSTAGERHRPRSQESLRHPRDLRANPLILSYCRVESSEGRSSSKVRPLDFFNLKSAVLSFKAILRWLLLNCFA